MKLNNININTLITEESEDLQISENNRLCVFF